MWNLCFIFQNDYNYIPFLLLQIATANIQISRMFLEFLSYQFQETMSNENSDTKFSAQLIIER